MTVPVQVAVKNKVVTASPVVKMATTVINGTKATTTSVTVAAAVNVVSTPTTIVAAAAVNPPTPVSPLIGTPVNHGANSDNGTAVVGIAVLNRDPTA